MFRELNVSYYSDGIDGWDRRFPCSDEKTDYFEDWEVVFDGCSSVRLVKKKFENVGGRWDVKNWGGDPKIEKISLTTPHLALCKQAKAVSESQSKTARLINHLHYASFSPVDELVFKVRRHAVGYLYGVRTAQVLYKHLCIHFSGHSWFFSLSC